MSINETVLEMHYHKPLMDILRKTYGDLGGTGQLNFYKYSPQLETFVGFDQAYARTDLSERAFFELLRESAANNKYQLDNKYQADDRFVGYFLQFKVVSLMKNKMKHTPAGITARPHYRASLDTTKNVNTGLSQHELLFRLSRNARALVYYACPMIFDRSALYDVVVDMDTLRLPDLISCPSEYSDNNQHYIYFNDINAEPIWCSDPTEGKATDPKTLAQIVLEHAASRNPAELASKLLDLLTNIELFGLSGKEEFFKDSLSPGPMLGIFGNTLTIVRISKTKERA